MKRINSYKRMITQYDGLISSILDQLTVAMGTWIEMDDCFLPDHLRPIAKILRDAYQEQRKLRKMTPKREKED